MVYKILLTLLIATASPLFSSSLAIYSKKILALSDLSDNNLIAIPSDPILSARALTLFQKLGLIQLKSPPSIQTISKNEKNLQFIEVEASILPLTIDEVSAVVMILKEDWQKDIIYIEDKA